MQPCVGCGAPFQAQGLPSAGEGGSSGGWHPVLPPGTLPGGRGRGESLRVGSVRLSFLVAQWQVGPSTGLLR